MPTATDPPPDWTDPTVPLGAGIDWSDPNSKLARVYARGSHVAAVVLIGLVAWLAGTRPLNHTDVWMHLAYGRWVAEHGALPDREPLSAFTDKDAPMFHPLWLSQYAGYKLLAWGGRKATDLRGRLEGGIEAISAVHYVVVVGTLGLLFAAYRRAGGSPALALAGLAVFALVALPLLFVQRPQAVGLLMFAATLALVRREPPGWLGVLVGVPVVFALWANLHGSFLVGLGLIGVLAVGRAIDAGTARDTTARRLAVAGVLGAVAATANPAGPAVYAQLRAFAGHPNLATFGEWSPMDFSADKGGHFVYWALLGLLVLTQAVSPRAMSAGEIVLALSFGVWPLLQQRAMIWWMAVLPALLLPHWAALAAARGWAAPATVPSFKKTVMATVLALILFGLSPAARWLRTGEPRPFAQSADRATPIVVAAVLFGQQLPLSDRVAKLAAAAPLPGGVVFATEAPGEYLQWAAPADRPVTMYTHGHLFPPAHWQDMMRVKAADAGWQDVLDKLKANTLVIDRPAHDPLAAAVRKEPGWRVVLDEPDGLLVAVRNGGPR